VSCGRRDEEEVLEKRLVGGVVIGWIGLVGVDAKGVGVARSSGFIGGVLLPHPGAIWWWCAQPCCEQGKGGFEQLEVELLFWKDCMASLDGGDMPWRLRRVHLMVAVKGKFQDGDLVCVAAGLPLAHIQLLAGFNSAGFAASHAMQSSWERGAAIVARYPSVVE
jgi:hypothetical protein